MKTTTVSLLMATLSLCSVSATLAGCGNSDAPASAGGPAAVNAAPSAPSSLSVERVLADVDTGLDPVATRANLEALLAGPSLTNEERASLDLALARALEGKDDARAISLLEDATSLGDEAAEKKLFTLLAGHEAPTWHRPAHELVVADSARALAKFYPAATPDNKVEIDIVIFGAHERANDTLGTFSIAEALRENAMEACGVCEEVKTRMHTQRSRERYWSAIPRYRSRLESALVVVYLTEETLIPERYAKWLAAPVADVRAAVARGEGLIAVKERVGAPPLIVLAAPRTALLDEVEAKFAAMSELPKAPVIIKLPQKLSVPEVQSGIRARFGSFKACYNSLLQRRPTAAGKIELAYTINGTGKLTDVTFTFDGTLEEPEHRACMDKAFATVRYPAWSKAPDAKITVRYPIVFNP